MDDRETVEHVPWAELAGGGSDERRATLVLAAVGLGALIVGLFVGRAVLAPAPTPIAAVPVDTTSAGPGATTGGGPEPTTTTTEAPLYREADLFASGPDTDEQAAAARAEWFVFDYFTADLEPGGGADVRAALPSGSDVPVRSGEAAGSVAYVEWAKALSVERVGSDTYRVEVAFRAVGAPPDRGFLRLPVRVVAVTVAVTPGGGTTVVDLPAPASLPPGPEPAPWPTQEAEAPAEVVAGAIAAAAAWGSEPRMLASQAVGDGWRVVLSVSDEVGNRWPLALTLDSTGRPAR
ncbi:MAG: hypothetical protein R3290_08645 [Acidimicrobiia bacterium]|nr:hypothetical protein [Acidimicrobiia bacterium]